MKGLSIYILTYSLTTLAGADVPYFGFLVRTGQSSRDL